MQTTRFEGRPCPSCKKVLDAASGEGEPRIGDISICVYCFAYSVFEKDSYRLMSNKEWLSLPNKLRMKLSLMRDIIMQAHNELDQRSNRAT